MFRSITLPALILACAVSVWMMSYDPGMRSLGFAVGLPASLFPVFYVLGLLAMGAYIVMCEILDHFIDGFRELIDDLRRR